MLRFGPNAVFVRLGIANPIFESSASNSMSYIEAKKQYKYLLLIFCTYSDKRISIKNYVVYNKAGV